MLVHTPIRRVPCATPPHFIHTPRGAPSTSGRYREQMRRKKLGELEEKTTLKIDEIFQDESYVQRMMRGGGGMRWGKDTSMEAEEGAKKGKKNAWAYDALEYTADKENPYEGMFDFDSVKSQLTSGTIEEELTLKALREPLTEEEQKLLTKVQIRPSKAKGPGKIIATGGVFFWVSLVPYVMIHGATGPGLGL